MRTWLTNLFPARRQTAPTTPTRRPRLALEWLEAREVPAITVQIDYSFDAAGFFSDPTRRAVLQQVADDIGSHLTANLAAITPGGGNSWTATFFNPATGQQATLSNLAVAGNTVVIYAGGRDLTGSEAGVGGFGGFGASGSQAWLDFIRSRGPGYTTWGGSLAFDTNGTNWFFGSSTGGLAAGQVDFYSVAAHELGHLFGIGTAPSWSGNVSGGSFVGGNATSVYGGPVPLSPEHAHWADGATVGGQPVSLDPYLTTGTRIGFSSLDYAALKDIGWGVSGVAGVAAGGPGGAAPSAPPVPLGSSLLQVASSGPGAGSSRLVTLTGPTDGSAQVFALGGDGQLAAAGARFQPFPGYTGIIRSTVADFDGDGAADFAFATGAGTNATVRIISGKTGADLVGPTPVLGGFTGGVFLAAGDTDRDGTAELAVSSDAGGSTRVSVYKVVGGGLSTIADFLAFDSAEFRGGSRVAVGDVNRDGYADLVVGAGVGGGPRVSVYDGRTLAAGQLTKLVPDFFALSPALRSGVYVTVGDVNGDGFADILYSTGDTGGPRVRVVSGAVLVANPGADVAALPALADFFVWDPNDRKGIRIAVRDLDGDGQAELVVGSGDKANAMARVIPFGQMNNPTTPLHNPLGNPATIDGVYVG
jgi:hypothetical protein